MVTFKHTPEQIAFALSEIEVTGSLIQALEQASMTIKRENKKDVKTYHCTFTELQIAYLYQLVRASESKNVTEHSSDFVKMSGGRA